MTGSFYQKFWAFLEIMNFDSWMHPLYHNTPSIKSTLLWISHTYPFDVWECEFDGHLWVLLVTSNKMISIVWYGNCPRQVQWNLNQSTAVTNTSWWKLCLCTYNHHWNIRNVSLNLLPSRQWSSPYSQTKLEISLVKVWEFSLWALTFTA